jgi:hypothetical protein
MSRTVIAENCQDFNTIIVTDGGEGGRGSHERAAVCSGP